MRGVLALFEGVATGAADGYARMAGRPAATLLHLGPGLGNGLANLHNARRAHSPVVNIVGDHATYHKRYDAQLQSDIETVARNVSTFVRTSETTAELGADAVDALVAAAIGPPGSVATLILPADVSWSEGGDGATGGRPVPVRGTGADARREVVLDSAAAALRSGEPLGASSSAVGPALEPLLGAGGRPRRQPPGPSCCARPSRPGSTAAPGGLRWSGWPTSPSSPPCSSRAPGTWSWSTPVARLVLRLPGQAERSGARRLHRAPGRRACRRRGRRPSAALAELVGAATGSAPRQQARPPGSAHRGRSPRQAVCQALGALLPEGAIVSDEGNTSGLFAPGATAGAPPHDWLCLTGGAIGQGLPVAVGAAVAAPDRRVLALESDGSALYTLQAWWTMAREGLDVTTDLLNNRSYAVLNMELDRVGAEAAGPPGPGHARPRPPDLDFVQLARGLGLHAARADTAEEFADELARRSPRRVRASWRPWCPASSKGTDSSVSPQCPPRRIRHVAG